MFSIFKKPPTGAIGIPGTIFEDPRGPVIDRGIIKEAKSDNSGSSGREELEYGDIICISRRLYKHFGVYASDSSVIHYSSPKSDISGENEIIETDLETFKRGNGTVYKLIFPEQYGDPTHVPTNGVRQDPMEEERKKWLMKLMKSLKYHLYSPEETVSRARSRLGEKAYQLLVNNCEHFAIWCKTGISESRQIDELLDQDIVIH